MIGRQLLFKEPVGVCFTALADSHMENRFFIPQTQSNYRFNARRILTNSSDLGPIMGYPDILRKQLMHNETRARNEEIDTVVRRVLFPDVVKHVNTFKPTNCDIAIEFLFSNEFKWHFGDRDIQTDAVDFRLMIAREITRGLGFESHIRLAENDDVIRAYPATDFKLRGKSVYARRSPLDNLLVGRNPPEIFNTFGRHLEQTNTRYPISAIFDKFEKLGLYKFKLPTYASFNLGFRLRHTAWQLGIIMRDSIVAKIDDGSHLSIVFQNNGRLSTNSVDGAEFLMSTQAAVKGVSLRQLMQQYNVENVYGPKMLKIFEALGYSTLSKPEVVQFAPDIPKKSRNPFSFLKKKNTY